MKQLHGSCPVAGSPGTAASAREYGRGHEWACGSAALPFAVAEGTGSVLHGRHGGHYLHRYGIASPLRHPSTLTLYSRSNTPNNPLLSLCLTCRPHTAIFMTIRMLDKSYSPGGRFFASVTPVLQPVFGARPHGLSPLTLVLVSMLSTAYIAHYNAPTFYSELRGPTERRFANMTLSTGWHHTL